MMPGTVATYQKATLASKDQRHPCEMLSHYQADLPGITEHYRGSHKLGSPSETTWSNRLVLRWATYQIFVWFLTFDAPTCLYYTNIYHICSI